MCATWMWLVTFIEIHMTKLPPNACLKRLSFFPSMVILSRVQFLLLFSHKKQHKRHGFVVVILIFFKNKNKFTLCYLKLFYPIIIGYFRLFHLGLFSHNLGYFKLNYFKLFYFRLFKTIGPWAILGYSKLFHPMLFKLFNFKLF
jgi:hypothetical protein